MTRLVYDGSFDGFLTAVFDVYERKLIDAGIVRASLYQPELTESRLDTIPDSAKAMRVWKALKKKVSSDKLNQVYKTFLSERSDMETILLQFIRYALQSDVSIENDFGNKAVLQIAQLARQVHREKHRMEAFVRFQQTRDNLYYASIEPDFNVLPLIAKHFKDRYADQHWIIYDRKRSYGLHYNCENIQVTEIMLEPAENIDREFLPESVIHEHEVHYQHLWKNYFASVNIAPRKNNKLHVRHVPLRYWKYLTEKH